MLFRTIPGLTELCATPDSFFERLDIGALNLICACGLPGAEQVDVARMLDWLDEAARQVDFQTRRHWYRFLKSPETYHASPGYFCCYFLLQVLQEDFGVKYNPARVRDPKFQDARCIDPDFRDSRDLFIHGIIDGPGGTCGSMPVIYVAVGRRLGYPLKLVETRSHLFFRWEDMAGARFGFPERFNVEGSGEGIHNYPDDDYRSWPETWSDAEIQGDYYLKSLTPSQELAGFLVTRGECLADHGRVAETIQCYRWACALAPGDPRYAGLLQRYSNRLAHEERQAIEYADELRARQRKRIEEASQGANRSLPNHAPSCECSGCRDLRAAGTPISAPGHLPNCQCILCMEARSKATGAVPGHSRNCHCYQCLEARSAASKPAGMPGHGPSCECFHCREARSSIRARGAPGHPSGCRCSRCLQSQTAAAFPTFGR